MRVIRQPGPAPQERAVVVPVRTIAVDAELPAGLRLLDALDALVRAHAAEGACLALSEGALGPFGYVMPALSPDAAHAAWYSAPVHPPGVTRWEQGGVTVGERDGAPFFHCHGIWTESDGTRRGGHVLPEETWIAEPMRARGAAITGGRFTARDDAETGFRLFEPVPTGGVMRPDGLAVRLRPNQDITTALRALAGTAGFDHPHIIGGVGSIIGARFRDAPAVEPFATELFLSGGRLDRAGAAGAALMLTGGLVDLTGAVATGTLEPGQNPILMTLEALICTGAGQTSGAG